MQDCALEVVLWWVQGLLGLCMSYDATHILDSTSVRWCTRQQHFTVWPVRSTCVLVFRRWSPLCALNLRGGCWLFIGEHLSNSPFWFQVARMPAWSFLWRHLGFPYWLHAWICFLGVDSGGPSGLFAKESLTCVAGPTWPLTCLTRHAVPTVSQSSSCG